MEARATIIVLFSICIVWQIKAQTDSVGYYALYLKKRNNNGTVKWVDPGDKIKIMTMQQRKFSKWSRVESISQQEIQFDNGENVRLDDISAVVKKNNPEMSFLGSIILGAGLGTLVYVSRGTVSFDQIEVLTFAGFSMAAIGIAIVTPPVFSKKKKSKIQIEKLYRH